VILTDTGAICNISPHIYGAQNIQNDNKKIIFGEWNQHSTSLKFDVCGWILNDQTRAVKMSDVVYVPTVKYKLFSLTRHMMQGWQLKGDKSKIEFYTNDFTVSFDIKIPTKNGFCLQCYAHSIPKNSALGQVTLHL
jgi:hypothetical protein